MGFFGPKISIELFEGSTYKTGGSVAGTVHLDTRSSLDLTHIDVMLRCRERVSLIALNNSSAYRSGAVWQRLSRRSTVFPSRVVLNQLDGAGSESRSSHSQYSQLPEVIEEPEELWRNSTTQLETLQPDSRFTQTYTLKKGVHKFPFEFTIPRRLPSSLRIDEENGIFWFLEAKAYRPGMLQIEKYTIEHIRVWKSNEVAWDPSLIDHKTKDFDIKVFFPGYAAAKKNKKKDKLLPKSLRKFAPVSLHLYYPIDGLFQSPQPLSVSFGLSCPHSDLLTVTQAEIYLSRRIYAKADQGRQQEYQRTYPLVSLRGLDAGFKEATDKINLELQRAKITNKISESHKSPLVTISYLLVAEIAVTSKEKPVCSDILTMRAPVVVHSLMAEPTNDRTVSAEGDDDEQLPRYSE